ncbi:rhamnogalacturonan acetylesterase [Draconibacterium sp. IB214405]|uniref:rhamnogalacturonan acetylesterase n=1 Tax=Draconibacterium sp. IB214405 TaxID=3097352 RepID=UPI002A141653|nr:rhamnogalacturonan acetylesterase [Draconibacterium sp. IB214405]MDX8339384.1 rhamnogalacturonan acetylesterase [Draconibacterium sp. IB214405]
MTRIASIFLVLILALGCTNQKDDTTKPTIYTIGDSTVKNGQGDGAGGLWGWGDPLVQYFDTTKVNLENHALGGTSSRTFRDKGLWQPVLYKLKPGDYVLMQFGHNDSGAVNDTIRARGTIKGTGEESEEIDNLITGKHEIVHSYGWYMRQYIREAKEKGAIPVVMAPIPRNDWEEGKVPRNNNSYGGWAKTVAAEEGAFFIDLNEKMASEMENRGEENVTEVLFFSRDHTHTSAKGAVLAASLIVEGLKELDQCKLKNYLLEDPKISFPVKKKVFIIGDSTVANGNDSIVGWGRELWAFMDTTRIEVINKARGGRSSRTYIYEGLWDEVLQQLSAGDFLLIQFGHNDGGNIDKAKYRGSLPGMGNETQDILRNDSIPETVHTYGWYMGTYINQAKEKGVSVIVISMIPRNIWKDGKVERVDGSYGGWAKEAAGQNEAYFIDLNNVIADKYEKMGAEKVKAFFPGDHTHTNAVGAKFNAETLTEQIKNLRTCSLHRYLN